MKFKIDVSSDELAEFLVLMRRSYGADPKEAEDNKYNQAVGKAIAESVNIVEAPVEKKGKQRRVDRGKVMALYKGNWTIKAIADEMKCSEQTVKNIIREANDAGKGK